MSPEHVRTVRLLLNVAPAIFSNPGFAMKGGTALNLFIQDMPRLSVDIDVAFVPHALEREQALTAIGHALAEVRSRVEAMGYRADSRKSHDGTEAKLFVRGDGAEVKVEVNFVFRGTVLPPERRSLTPSAQEAFTTDIQLPVLATPELYGSKLVAALDRQHPRDLFDVRQMLMSGGWDETLLDCFVVYLAGHNRPAHEVLFPREKPLGTVFEGEFSGMTALPVRLEDLEATRRQMLDELPRALLPRHRNFLLSLMLGHPDWSLMPYPHLRDLPAIQWKLENLRRLAGNPGKFRRQHEALAERLAAAA